jgi:hypothetical protein
VRGDRLPFTRRPSDALAAALAERLGFRLVGRSELVTVAEHLVGFDTGWEGSPELRERSPAFCQRLNDERARYVGVLRGVMMELAEQDNVVIVGLGAGQLLGGFAPRAAPPGGGSRRRAAGPLDG